MIFAALTVNIHHGSVHLQPSLARLEVMFPFETNAVAHILIRDYVSYAL
jgi:hypothetical protein